MKVLFILMRTDMLSMNPGKAFAKLETLKQKV